MKNYLQFNILRLLIFGGLVGVFSIIPNCFPVAAETNPQIQELQGTIENGRGVVYFGSVQESRDAAPMRISFTHIPDPDLEQD